MTVYKSYDQKQLNDQYNTRLRVPDYSAYFERWEKLSRQTDISCEHATDVLYGQASLETLDIFPAAIPGAKTMIFIHGGYWHLLDKSIFHFLTRPFLKRHVTTVLINYPLAPAASIDDIVKSCREAIEWVHQNIIHYNGDPSELYVTGHSAGGHLATMLVTEKNPHFVKGIVSLSGLFRLEPVMHSYVNDVLGMDLETALRNSPVLLTLSRKCPLLLFTGADESEEFRHQSLDLYNHWQRPQGPIELLQVDERNHYSILDAFAEEGSPVLTRVLGMMNILS